MRTKRPLAVTTIALVVMAAMLQGAPEGAGNRQVITAREAKNHIGQTRTICGKVASARYAVVSRGSPTFLNLDHPYPNHVFTVVIWGRDRAKFGTPEKDWKGKCICVTGKIEEYRSVPEVILKDPQQVEVFEEEGPCPPQR